MCLGLSQVRVLAKSTLMEEMHPSASGRSKYSTFVCLGLGSQSQVKLRF